MGKVAHEPYASLHRAIELNRRQSLQAEKVILEFHEESVIEETNQNVIETTFEERLRVSSARGSLAGASSNEGKSPAKSPFSGNDGGDEENNATTILKEGDTLTRT
mmetsp:Transcript_31824/g.42140  ORF Transcript_31824/g.42140 Transcript_31824/m.42140 type:complete len:106 (+) Transcript_31824:763-1080(+)|eukprot:CAMPEP_0185589796 /NCGR_PEP_ID=MMETSP0434-20130131/58364_1 /TAXON_ID=626734 ORGANISM="Favella taraikaensis, Strain Fe Narragansett Bay" /NCGR_SAMPLE_ID=MMETSP0434 /ASSEMBLY_ACC=CAM_ASM_000379 /LENGTH=105 /DNA_ID=CAMNT_0028213481 /DNA_START=753 /DNA_END=1070 /DNA_ORIENTATION=-